MTNEISNSQPFAIASSPQRDSANLDLLRSVAVMSVFFTHLFSIYTGTGTKWGFLWHLGQLGVLMFFVHTSVVLMWSLERSHQQGSKLFASFYVRRFFRLYPLSIVCVLVAYFIDLRWNPINLWQNLTLTQDLFYTGQPEYPPLLTPLWSLPLEVQMYVALPVLFLLLRNRSIKVLGVLWCTFVALSFLQSQLGERFGILKFAPCFLGGVITWRVMRQRDTAKLPGWLWPLGIAIVSVIWITATEKYLPLHIAGFGLCMGLAIPLFREIPWPFLRTASRIIARYSYSIYLTHFAIQIYCFSDPRYPWFKGIRQLPRLEHYARPVHFAMFIALTIVITLALYHFVENPGIQLGHRVARWITDSNGRGGTGAVKTDQAELELSAAPTPVN